MIGMLNFFRGEKCKRCGHRKCRCGRSTRPRSKRSRKHGAISQMPNTAILSKDPVPVDPANEEVPATTELHGTSSRRRSTSQPGHPSSSKHKSKRGVQTSSTDHVQLRHRSHKTELGETSNQPRSTPNVGQSSKYRSRAKRIVQTFSRDHTIREHSPHGTGMGEISSRSRSASDVRNISSPRRKLKGKEAAFTFSDQAREGHDSDGTGGTRDSIKTPASSIGNQQRHYSPSELGQSSILNPRSKENTTAASIDQVPGDRDVDDTAQSLDWIPFSTTTRQRQSSALRAIRTNLEESNSPRVVSVHDSQASNHSSMRPPRLSLPSPSRMGSAKSPSIALRDGPARLPFIETDSVAASWKNLKQGLLSTGEAAEQNVDDTEIQSPAHLASVRSILTTPHDMRMASRQMSINTLPANEQKEQEAWAQSQLKKNASSSCPTGLIWIRYGNGYRCLAGGHYVSDELLAEGKGGYYNHGLQIRPGKKIRKSWGPFYGVDPRLGKVSPNEAARIRREVFGKENPTVEDCLW